MTIEYRVTHDPIGEARHDRGAFDETVQSRAELTRLLDSEARVPDADQRADEIVEADLSGAETTFTFVDELTGDETVVVKRRR